MGHKKPKPQKDTKPAGFLDLLTSRTGKVVAAIAVVGTLATQVENFVGSVSAAAKTVIGLFSPPHSEPAAPAAIQQVHDCFKADINVKPVAFAVQKWREVNFHLTGRNDCKQKLDVHIAYKSQSESLRIEPPFKSSDRPSCTGYEVPDCWQSQSIDGGQQVDQRLVRPRLINLGELTEPAEVAINWVVFHTTSKTPIRSGTAGLTVRGKD